MVACQCAGVCLLVSPSVHQSISVLLRRGLVSDTFLRLSQTRILAKKYTPPISFVFNKSPLMNGLELRVT